MMEDKQSELLLAREESIAELSAFFTTSINECKKIYEDAKISFAPPKQVINYKPVKRKSIIYETVATRKSARLANVEPMKYGDLDDLEELEDRLYVKRKVSISQVSRRSVPVYDFKKPEDITEAELDMIATSSVNKSYSQTGTSCHQCRQKTLDTKTVCRSGVCLGVRGQFCGPCLKNRYGESVREALLNATWSCPPCRDLCNCSICRTREGKMPTGILAPLAQQEGFISVKDFLLRFETKEDNTRRKRSHSIFIKELFERLSDSLMRVYSPRSLSKLVNLKLLLLSYIVKVWEHSVQVDVCTGVDSDLVGFYSGIPVFIDSDMQLVKQQYWPHPAYISHTSPELIPDTFKTLNVLTRACIIRNMNLDHV